MQKIPVSYLLGLVFFISCTQAYRLSNRSKNELSIKIEYNICSNPEERNNHFIKTLKKGMISSTTYKCIDSVCYFDINLLPQKSLLLNPILQPQNETKQPDEKRLISIGRRLLDSQILSYDTILFFERKKIDCESIYIIE